MVGPAPWWGALVICLASQALAESPQDQMFPDRQSCYARTYTKAQLADHPQQRVTRIAVRPDLGAADPFLGLRLTATLRGTLGGAVEALASCENEGGHTLYCTMEGDAGAFQITPAKNGAILIEVASLGMGFETETDFVTLSRDTGDDRSFLLQPAPCQ